MLYLTNKLFHWSILRNRIHTFFLVFFWALAPVYLFAQTPTDTSWQCVKKVSFKNRIAKVSNDRYFNIYIGDEKQNIFKYSTVGDSLLGYSPTRTSDIHLVEAWNGLKILVFYRDAQDFVVLDRYLGNADSYALENIDVFARVLSFSSDNNLWLFNDNDFTLRKYSLNFSELTIKTPCDLLLDPQEYDLNFIREYQNQVFLVDRNYGILVFDNMGNYKKKIPFKGLNFISFYDNDMYFVKDEKLIFFDLYGFDTTEFALPAGIPDKINYTIVGDNYVYLFTNKELYVYKKTSETGQIIHIDIQ